MKRWISILCALMVAVIWPGAAGANQDAVSWGEPQKFIYDNLHPYTLNWSGDPLDRGGLSLTKLEIVSASEADIVINQYGAMGAGGILKLTGESLEDETERKKSGFLASMSIEEGAIYLVKLHDGKLAKIRIDSMAGGLYLSKVIITFVLEEEKAQPVTPAPSNPPKQPNADPAQPSVPPKQAPSDSWNPEGPAPSAPKTTDNWSENYVVPSNSQDQGPAAPGAFSIHLRLKSYTATIEHNGEENVHRLPVAPFLSKEGRTMVPLRFISEALGAEVIWGAKEQSIDIVNETTRIQLWVNSKRAVVNNKAYELDAPPLNEKGSVVVPLRFVSEHMDMLVYFKHGQILITDTESHFFDTIADALQAPPWIKVPEYYYGKWTLWISGAYAPVDSRTNFDGSREVRYEYTPGADADWVEIHADGTFTWRYLGKDVKGYWGIGDLGNIKLYDTPVAIDGEAWTMRYENDQESTIYAWGIEYKATKASK